MTKLTRLIIVGTLLAASAQAAMAGTKEELQALRSEVEALQQGQEQIQKDLAEIKKLLEQGARAPAAGPKPFEPTDIEIGEVAYKGANDAPVTLIEYSDYQCPYCKRHATAVMPELIKSYVDSGKVRFIMREYPIPNLHPRATAASEAALCARDQGQYWGMHDLLFADQRAMADQNFKDHAASMGLDVEAFSACLESDAHMVQIRADQAEGQKLGISGTPSFVVGLTDSDDPDTVHLTKFIRGAQPFATFSAAIDDLLKSADAAE